MRITIVVAVLLITSTGIYSQTPQRNTTTENYLPQSPDLAYPTAGYLAPEISLQRALKIAEGFIKRERIDISRCYLISAKWVVDETKTKNGGWRFYWVHSERVSRNVLIAVSVEGKPYRIHQM